MTQNFLAEKDIFSLLGSKDLPDDQKALLLSQMMEIVVTDFFKTEAEKLLGEKDVSEIENLQKKGAPVEEIIRALKEKIPDIENRLFKKTFAFKKEFVKKHLKFRLELLKKSREILDKSDRTKRDITPEEKIAEMKKLDGDSLRIGKALNLYEQDRWEEGFRAINLMTQLFAT